MNTSDRAESASELSEWVRDARGMSLALIEDLDDDQLVGPYLPTINPLLWEVAHAAWFQEHWVLQHAARRQPILRGGDRLFDSISIAHETRWSLPVPSRADVLKYVGQVRDETIELLQSTDLNDSLIYFVKLSVFHEDMHTEAFTYTRQTLGYPRPQFVSGPRGTPGISYSGDCSGDAELPGGRFLLGAPRSERFVFDNEKWAHAVEVAPFAISRTAVTQSQFAEFVNDGGYQRRDLWSDEGWQWRQSVDAKTPLYWKRNDDGDWCRRQFDGWNPLEPNAAMIHVNWYESDAYCRWSGRRLPSEAEWELAAGGLEKRRYPWGDEPPEDKHANLDWRGGDVIDVRACHAGATPQGCLQMLGNVWQWTATKFGPYPGFSADPYKEYSRGCFDECKVLRGGCWTTRSRLLRNTWRNFYQPDRRDVWAGFRTCAV